MDWTHIATTIATLGIGYLVDRFRYNRRIAKTAEKLVKELPDGDIHEIATQAIVAENLKEADRVLKAHQERQREHEVRMAAIRAGGGEVNVGSFKK